MRETTNFSFTKMFKIGCLLILTIAGTSSVRILSRDEWGANPPTGIIYMDNPVPYVVIHHSESPGACSTTAECIAAMQSMQNYHQNTNGWNIIGYSFGVGGDGNAYEGRGWSTVGAHAPGYNFNSIRICVIGNWMAEVSPANQLQSVHELISYGVELGMIRSDYTLVGHRQVTDIDCPGHALYNEIQSWAHIRKM